MIRVGKIMGWAALMSTWITGQTLLPVDSISQKLYDDTELAVVHITIDTTALNWVYNNVQSDSLHLAQFHFQNRWIDETVDSVGFRIRGNTSRVAAKKSFKISFNTFVPGREFYGVDKLNLNGEHNDPSIIRSKLSWDAFKEIGMIASRAAHAKVYINDVYYGLYISVEHVDDEFLRKNFADDTGNLWKCLYPADLNYLGADPTLYQNLTDNGRPAYELKSNEDQADFSELARFINALNNTASSNLPDSLEHLLDVTGVLKYVAMDILFGNWDDYWSLMNNYYLYHNPSHDRFTLIPYDYDNNFGIDWFNIDWATVDPYNFPKVVNGDRPLVERLLNNHQYHDLYTHFLSYFNAHVLNLATWEPRIDSLREMISSAAFDDDYRTLDYNFTFDDFNNSYSESGYNNQHVKRGLKEFITLRHNSLSSQLTFLNAPPSIYAADWTPRIPQPMDSIQVTIAAFGSAGLSNISLKYLPTESNDTLSYTMYAAPVSGNKRVELADRWVGMMPPLSAGGSGHFWIVAEDDLGQTQKYPRQGSLFIQTSVLVDGPVINEFMADNDGVATDPDGDTDDWLELYNATDSPFLLTGLYMTDNPESLTKWQFTQNSLYIQPDEFLVIWCDDDEEQSGIHTNFKLSKNGEYLALVDMDGVSVIDSFSFGEQETDIAYGRYPDGSENWAFLSGTPGMSNVLLSTKPEVTLAKTFSLSAYPNPFNPMTTIAFDLPTQGDVAIDVYNLSGERAWSRMIMNQSPGYHTVSWSGVDQAGQLVGSGIYFMRVAMGGQSRSLKITLLK